MFCTLTGSLGHPDTGDFKIYIFSYFSQTVEFCMLTASISVLMCLFKQLDKQEDFKQAFRNEKRILFFILIIFDLSYIARLFYDHYHIKNASEK